MAAWYICLICDGRGGTFLRLRPHQIYACADCVKRKGGKEAVLGDIKTHIQAFQDRHKEIKPIDMQALLSRTGLRRRS